MSSTIELLDSRADSLTVTWPPPVTSTNNTSIRYVLEYRIDNDDNENNNNEFQELSNKLIQPQARKRNLLPNTAYYFRAAPIVNDKQGDWITHPIPFRTLTQSDHDRAMAAPKVTSGGNHAVVVSWTKFSDTTTGYELQMRENVGGQPWTTIAASLSNTEVKKKNLTSTSGYQFRVRPVLPDDNNVPFSPPSDPIVAKGLSNAMKRWFQSLDDGTLLRSGVSKPIELEDALGGKEFVLLYASAHWCPPCRQYTPMLANWYKTVRNNVEIVFLSADHDENQFQNYFTTQHPWLAVDYDDDTREQLMATIKVTGIPRLVVIRADTGTIVEDNAVGKPLDLNRWRTMIKK